MQHCWYRLQTVATDVMLALMSANQIKCMSMNQIEILTTHWLPQFIMPNKLFRPYGLFSWGAETQGGWGIYSPIIWLYPPQSFSVVCICIPPPNNLILVCIWVLVSTWIREKKWRSFFWSSLNLLTRKNRGSSPPMLKIGQIWVKIANYFPQCSTKIGTPGLQGAKV